MSEKDELPKRVAIEVSHPHLREFVSFLPELNKESDRGMVLIATSFIDELMKRTLLAFFIEGEMSTSLIEGFNAPLGSLATRSAAAVALGLISQAEKRDSDLLRKIRNRFAHHVHVSFDDDAVKALCNQLTLAAKDYGDVVVGARGQFNTSAVGLILNLTNRPHYVSKQRRGMTAWPY